MSIVDTSITAAAAALSGVAAWGAWKASREANATASSVAQIERDRWHRELTPQLRIKLETTGARHTLYVRFDAPAALRDLTVELTIRDDMDRSRFPHLAGGPTPEQTAEVIWGPYRFNPRVEGSDGLGRAVSAFALLPGDRQRLVVEPSTRPSWYNDADGEQRWREEYRTEPIRLWALCTASGHKPWRLSFGVPQDGSWALGGI
ncbi:hypothetical protein [Streptomyces sp. NPDC003015]